MIDLNQLPVRARIINRDHDDSSLGESHLETGMLVDIVAVEHHADYDSPEQGEACYRVTLNAERYYEYNLPLMARNYYANKHTPEAPEGTLFTAVEAGFYTHDEYLFFYLSSTEEDPTAALNTMISELMTPDVTDDATKKVNTARLIDSHRQLRDAVSDYLFFADRSERPDLQVLLDKAEQIEREAKQTLS